MKYTRTYVEMKSRLTAGAVDENEYYKWVTALNSFQMYVMKGDKSVAPCLERDGFWESWVTTWVINNVHSNGVFIDIGANAGYYSYLAKNIGAKVIAFEPNESYAEMMRATNERTGHVVNVNELAVSDKEGFATLHVPLELHGSASLGELDAKYLVHEYSVRTTTLDAFFNDSHIINPVYVKIDAEGAEEKIWDGAQEFLANVQPIIIMEYTPGAYGRDFLDKLESYGDLKWIDHDGEEQAISKSDILAHGDWLMLVIRPRRNTWKS